MRRLSLSVALALALSACLKPAPPPAAAPPEVVAGTATVSLSLPPAAVAGWTGTWTSGGRATVIARSGDTLTANGQPLTLVGLGTFADTAGTAYLFGPGPGLTTVTSAGAETRWTRS